VATGQGQVPLGDAGFEHGGDIPGHGSHNVGMDIDIWPIRIDSAQCTAGRITWQSATYDRAATRQLAQAIRNAAPGHVKLIFFNDPTLISEGLTTQYPNHEITCTSATARRCTRAASTSAEPRSGVHPCGQNPAGLGTGAPLERTRLPELLVGIYLSYW
jgi:hypothetical protein